MTDVVDKPNHYCQHVIEPINFIMKNDLPFAVGNAIKYLVRSTGETPKIYDGLGELDSRLTDLRKAKRYIEMQMNLLQGYDEL